MSTSELRKNINLLEAVMDQNFVYMIKDVDSSCEDCYFMPTLDAAEALVKLYGRFNRLDTSEADLSEIFPQYKYYAQEQYIPSDISDEYEFAGSSLIPLVTFADNRNPVITKVPLADATRYCAMSNARIPTLSEAKEFFLAMKKFMVGRRRSSEYQ